MEDKAARQEAWKTALRKEAGRFTGQIGIFLRGLGNNIEFSYRSDQCFAAASLIKIPLFLAASEIMGEQKWESQIPIDPRNRAGGTGVIAHLNESFIPTWKELLFLSIAWSDNTAANQILDCIGGFPAVQDWIRRNRLTHTQMQRKMMDRKAEAEGRENRTSAEDIGNILFQSAAHALEKAAPSAQDRLLLEAMKQQHYRNKLPARIPSEAPDFEKDIPSPGHVLVWNKTGDLGCIQHDAGIFALPSGQRYILVICTEHEKNGQTGARWIAEMSRCIWRLMTDENLIHSSSLPDETGHYTN